MIKLEILLNMETGPQEAGTLAEIRRILDRVYSYLQKEGIKGSYTRGLEDSKGDSVGGYVLMFVDEPAETTPPADPPCPGRIHPER